MADAPWQCPQCGTVNEPSANSCRSCGRWPSLFDLERGSLPTAADQDEGWSRRPPAESVDVETFEPGAYEEHHVELPPVDVEAMHVEEVEVVDEAEDAGSGRGRLIRSLIVPIAFAIYIVISIIFGDRSQ